MARGRRAGTGLGAMAAFFAAMAEARGLTLATRHVRHFASLGIALLDPWSDGPSTSSRFAAAPTDAIGEGPRGTLPGNATSFGFSGEAGARRADRRGGAARVNVDSVAGSRPSG